MSTSLKRIPAGEDHWLEILTSPNYFLHSIDVKRACFGFVKSSAARLAATAFLDGRTALGENQKLIELPIQACLDWRQSSSHRPDPHRFIFHMSFCGSTLLSRALTIDSKAITIKEPLVLLQLAEIKAAEVDQYRDRLQWQQLLDFVLSQIQKAWHQQQAVLVKPSNWANSMLPELMRDAGDACAVLLTIEREDYLQAVFRGGGERVQFMYSVLNHLLTAFPEYRPLVRQLEAQPLDSADLFARLSLVSHAVQSKAFRRLQTLSPGSKVQTVSFTDLIADPAAALKQASDSLQLALSQEDIRHSVRQSFRHHSKVTEREFDQQQSQQVNQAVAQAYRTNFAHALEWADKALAEHNFQ